MSPARDVFQAGALENRRRGRLAARRSFARGLLLSSDDEDLEQQMKHESASIVQMSRSHDGFAGVKAFKDKVEPSFTGS
jgi:hypothetical protein